MSEQTNYLDLARQYVEAQRALDAARASMTQDQKASWEVLHNQKLDSLMKIHCQFRGAVGPDSESGDDCRCFLVGCRAVIVLWDAHKFHEGFDPVTTLCVEVEDGNHHHCTWP